MQSVNMNKPYITSLTRYHPYKIKQVKHFFKFDKSDICRIYPMDLNNVK